MMACSGYSLLGGLCALVQPLSYVGRLAFKSKTKCIKITVKTKQCINVSILLWQHVLVLLDHLQGSIQKYEVQSGHIICTPCM
jgi:hypothetical protein